MDYLHEALAELAYVEYLMGNFLEAKEHAVDAFWGFQRSGAIKAISAIRKLLACILFRLGKAEASEGVLDSIEDDALGLKDPVPYELLGC